MQPLSQQVSWMAINAAVLSLAQRIQIDKRDFNSIYAIPRGGLVPGVMLSHRLEIPLITDEKLITEKTLLVDDISDTGDTLAHFMRKQYMSLENGIAENVATIFYKKGSAVCPKYYHFVKKTRWIEFPWEQKGNGMRG